MLGLLFLVFTPYFGTVVGVMLLALTASCIYSFIKNEEWTLEVNDGVLTWDYPRWPTSKGQIDLANVKHIRTHDSWCTFTFVKGAKKRLRILGNRHRFYAYLEECFPNIILELSESS